MTNQDNIATQIEQIAMSHFAGANITDFVVEEYDEDEMSGVLIIEYEDIKPHDTPTSGS